MSRRSRKRVSYVVDFDRDYTQNPWSIRKGRTGRVVRWCATYEITMSWLRSSGEREWTNTDDALDRLESCGGL